MGNFLEIFQRFKKNSFDFFFLVVTEFQFLRDKYYVTR